MQVVDDLNDGKPGNEFVGIAIDFINKKGVIYHTRPLLEDDIIHELLHVRFPDWSEQKVDNWTNLLISQSDINLLKLERASWLETGILNEVNNILLSKGSGFITTSLTGYFFIIFVFYRKG